MNGNKKVVEIMTKDLVTIDISDSIHEMLDLMVNNDVTALPVVSAANKCVGMVTLRDLLEATSESEQLLTDGTDDIFDRLWIYDHVRDRLGGERVDTVMSHAAIRLHADSTVEEAAELMLRNAIHHLPVVAADDNLVGLVSSLDLLNVLAPNFDRRQHVVHHHDTASAEAYEAARHTASR